jgi:hypothetical protein
MFINAAIADPAQGQLVVRAFDRATGKPLWVRPLQLGAPIVHILMLDSDRNGRVYVAADVGHESANPPYQLVDEWITVVRLDGGGEPRGSIEVPPIDVPDESMRPLTIDDEGNLYVMRPGPNGLTINRYSF